MWNFTYFDTSPKKTVFFPQYLDMFWFWSLLAVAMQLRFCHTSFCSFWLMLVFSHTHALIFICLEAEMALLSARFFNENSTNVVPLMLKTCVLYWCSQPLTHTQYIYTQRRRMWMGAAARSRGSCCWRPSCPQRSPRHERGDVVWNVYKAVRGRTGRRPGRSTCTLWPETAKKHTMVGVSITQA